MAKSNSLAISMLLFGAFPLSAQDIETIEVYGNFEPAVVSQLPSSAWVMELDTIQSISGYTALDVLAHVPGISIRKSGGVQEIFLRGAETNFVVIQIDGIQVNNPMDSRGGGFDLASIGKSSLVRVEVTKGAQSLSYGSDAIAGVINLVTLDTNEQGVVVSAGLLPKGQKSLSLSGYSEKYAASLNLREGDRQSNGEKQNQLDLSLLGNFEPTQYGQTRINLRLSDYRSSSFPDQSGGVLYSPEQGKDKKELSSLAMSLRHLQQVSDAYSSSLQLEYLSSEDKHITPGIEPFFNAPPASTKNEYSFYKTRWLNKLTLSNFEATLGLDYKSESGKTSGFLSMFSQDIVTDYQQDRDNLGGFADLNWSIGALTLFSGVRHDSTADFNEQTTSKLALDYRFSQQTRFFANWGTAFKLPSIYALSNSLIGNAELKPEEAENIDLGLNYGGDDLTASIAIFQYEYSNLVDFDGEAFALVNRSEIQSKGSELVVSYNPDNNLSLTGDVTYVDLDSSSGELLTGRPKWQGGLAATYQVTPTIRAHGKLRYVSGAPATSLHTGELSVFDLDSYDRVDAVVEWQYTPEQRVDFHFQNVLDRRYQEAVGFPGNEFGLGVQFYWQLGGRG